MTNSLSWISRFNPSKTRCPSNSTTMSLRLMIVLLILHPPLRILSLTSKIPGSASLCRLRFPPDCGAGNQPAGKPPPQYKTLSTPSSFLYRSPQKACSNRNGNPARFRRYRNWMLRLCAALERCARIRRIFMRAKRLLDFCRKSGVHRCKGIAGKTTIHSDYNYNIMQKFVNYFCVFFSKKQ